jgi:hypothetical protein
MERPDGVEAGQHAVDRILNQFLVRDRINVLAAYLLEHISEQGEQPVEMPVVKLLNSLLLRLGAPAW